ncbi:MAG: polyprenyl synthetase family protein [Bacteroidota bacterium]
MKPALKVNEISELISQKAAHIKLPDQPSRLYDPIKYILALGGKRLRPLLALMTYNLFRDDVEENVLPALSIEVFHNFTLIHDDIMDKAPIRRGKETVHKKWNDNVAILSGDAMMVKAYELLQSIAVDKLPQALKAFNQTALEVCEGQQYDMDFEDRSLSDNPVSEQEYMEMIRLKTSVLFGFSMQLGALLGSDNEEAIQQLYDAGIQLGLAFQLQDDLLDLYGGEKFGKQVGGDILNAKKTYLLVKALEIADASDKKMLIDTMANNDISDSEKIESIKSVYDRYEIKKITQSQIVEHLLVFKNSIEDLNKFRSQNIIELVDSLTHRKA